MFFKHKSQHPNFDLVREATATTVGPQISVRKSSDIKTPHTTCLRTCVGIILQLSRSTSLCVEEFIPPTPLHATCIPTEFDST